MVEEGGRGGRGGKRLFGGIFWISKRLIFFFFFSFRVTVWVGDCLGACIAVLYYTIPYCKPYAVVGLLVSTR